MGSDTTIIALDLGKFKSVACVMDGSTRRHRFETLATTLHALHALFAANVTADPSRTLVVVECCDAAGWVHDLAAALGLSVAVANANHEAWRWNKVKRKTDRDDALKLARMALNEELPTVHVPPPPVRQRRRLIPHRPVSGRAPHAVQERDPLDLLPAGSFAHAAAREQGLDAAGARAARGRGAAAARVLDRRPVARPPAPGAGAAGGPSSTDPGHGTNARRAGAGR
jgi:hypothetical protein